MNDDHKITRDMLNTIREGKLTKGKLLNEDVAEPSGAINNNGSIQPSLTDVKAEQNKFMQIVGPRVEFTSFNIYPNDNNVVFAGKFDDGLQWQFSKKDGLYINADNLKLDSDGAELIKKLFAYYQNWVEEWSTRLNQEFKPNSNG